ncbi:uncharacterized protein K452DRAFT_316431 [Aplosporella prunicola CBS 121167]|uniref:DUF7730 domain-containing protein n=1 Tax=Aplosporella prunicola CBS 121167 TaxID=1176127 RepID=A0A6A6BMC2_9PEZI|nr:uncharacterized protein K452DRAFT_316431 [Aplosporella prunicola CBS 121167]KAF2144434.1 hypothetical protein K452DRAFT_316431 [Aplosporella prunicola CBS 121167]
MSATISPTRASKRKRAAVNYREVDDNIDDNVYDSDWPVKGKPLKRNKKTASNKPLPKRKIFPFLKLPRELKDMIYEHVLRDSEGINLVNKTKQYRRTVQRVHNFDEYRKLLQRKQRLQKHRHCCGSRRLHQLPSETEGVKPLALQLLVTCRQIHDEALPILYGSNAFTFENMPALFHFLANTSTRNRALLKDLTVCSFFQTSAQKAMNPPAFALLATGALNLNRLFFDCLVALPKRADKAAIRLYRDAYHWLEAVGAAKGRSDAAVDVVAVSDVNYLITDAGDREKEVQSFKDTLGKLLRGDKLTKRQLSRS